MQSPLPEVPRRRFGRTEVMIPVFSCGGMRYQASWQDLEEKDVPVEGQENLEATIHRAVELGINHIETARGYGSSELQLGRVLPRFRREQLLVQTKIGPRETAKEFLEVFEQSMSLLRLDYVDFLSIHGINLQEHIPLVTRRNGSLEAIRQLQKDGRVRHVGFSTHGPTDVLIDAINTGEFDYINLHWYFVNTVNQPAIDAARKQDMGVFIISPSDKGGKLYEPSPKLSRFCEPLHPMAFNDLWCLRNEDVHTLSLGAARPSDFDIHVDAMRHYEQRIEMTEPIARRIHAEGERMLGADWWNGWEEGIPPHADLPNDVNAWEILRLWNWAKVMDLTEYGKMRYNLLGNGGHWFPGHNAKRYNQRKMRRALAGSPFRDWINPRLKEAHTLLFTEPKKRLSQSD